MSLELQSAFAAALCDLDQPVPDGLTSWIGDRPAFRFGVYRNNVQSSLAGVLASRCPAAERIVGEEFFRAMAAAYIAECPPRSPLMMTYGESFGDFVESFAPAASLPYLADVIRLDLARGRAYHAADLEPLDGAKLQSLPEDALAELIFHPHPASFVLRSAHPVVTIWSMNSEGGTPSAIEDWIGEDALVTRPQLDVEVRQLPPGGAAFLAALMDGAPLEQALTSVAADYPDFDLATHLAGALQAGVFCDVSVERTPS